MATHVLTPARRAALRKAQLASARKRRKHGVGSQAKRAVSQRVQYAKASHGVKKAKQSKKRKALKYTAIGLGTAVAAAGAIPAHDAYFHSKVGKARRTKKAYKKGRY